MNELAQSIMASTSASVANRDSAACSAPWEEVMGNLTGVKEKPDLPQAHTLKEIRLVVVCIWKGRLILQFPLSFCIPACSGVGFLCFPINCR